jgi:type II secretory pathway pseudopilin PulG
MMKSKKRGQVWVETVIYTLIGLALIGIILAIISPRITEARDRITVEQTIDSLSVIDETINVLIDKGPGNVRQIEEFKMRRGELLIDTNGNNIAFVLNDLKKPYSEPGVLVKIGPVSVLSEEGAKYNPVTLKLDYEGIADITYSGIDLAEPRKFVAATIPYRFTLKNLGPPEDPADGTLFIISIEEVSG